MIFTRRKLSTAYPRLEKWCVGKPPVIRVLAKLFVLSADDINWGLNEYSNNVPLKAVTLPDDPVKIMWLYRRNRIVRRRIMANIFNLDMTTANFIDNVWCHTRTLLRRSPDYLRKMLLGLPPRDFQLARRFARKSPRLFDWLFDRAAIQLITSPPPNRSELTRLHAPEIQVYARIMAHCYLLTGLWPSQLLRKARNGDTKALFTLLRFDRSVIHDPKIRAILHREEKLRPHTHSQILTKLKPKQGKRLRLSATRYHFSAMLRAFGKKIGHPVTIEDLTALWRAYDVDCGRYEPSRVASIEEDKQEKQMNALKKGVRRQLADRAPMETPTILP